MSILSRWDLQDTAGQVVHTCIAPTYLMAVKLLTAKLWVDGHHAAALPASWSVAYRGPVVNPKLKEATHA